MLLRCISLCVLGVFPRNKHRQQSSRKGPYPSLFPGGSKAEPSGQNLSWCLSCGSLCYYQILIWALHYLCSSIVAFHYLHFNGFTTGTIQKVLILQFGKCYYCNNHSLALGQVLRAPLQKVSCWDVWTTACQTALVCAQKSKLLPSRYTGSTPPCQKFPE